jgi:hypothetical protein
VPVSLEPINTVDKVAAAKEAGRLSIKQTYEQILSDLDYAEANLIDTRPGNDKIVRATKGAAIAAKARVYQHMSDWSNVIAESSKIVSGAAPFSSPIGGYQLTARPDGAFANNGGNTESLFSIENSDTDNPTTNGCLYQMYYGRSLVCVSPIIINASFWLADDLRREQLLEHKDRYGSKDAYWSTKYRSSTFADYAPVIRYAEVLDESEQPQIAVSGPQFPGLPSPEEAETLFGVSVFDRILIREPWKKGFGPGGTEALPAMQTFAAAARRLLAPEGRLVLLKTPPVLGERISRILESSGPDKRSGGDAVELLNKLREVEESFFTAADTGSGGWTWTGETLEMAFSSYFDTAVTLLEAQEERLLTERDLSSWFDTEKSRWGRYIAAALGDGFNMLQGMMRDRAKEGPVLWRWKSLLVMGKPQ